MANINVCAKFQMLPKRHRENAASFKSVPTFVKFIRILGQLSPPRIFYFLFFRITEVKMRDIAPPTISIAVCHAWKMNVKATALASGML
jgi:hypothetical protein